MTRLEWAQRFLRQLGVPVTDRTRMAMVVWMQSEGSPARWNPLATILPMPGAVTMNSAGVKHYPDRRTGLEASLRTIREEQYDEIVRRLARNSYPRYIVNAIAESPWGTDGELMLRVLRSARRGYFDDYASTAIPD